MTKPPIGKIKQVIDRAERIEALSWLRSFSGKLQVLRLCCSVWEYREQQLQEEIIDTCKQGVNECWLRSISC